MRREWANVGVKNGTVNNDSLSTTDLVKPG